MNKVYQDVFNKVISGLKNQHWKQSVVSQWNANNVCKYYSDVGRCAIGHLMSNDELDKFYYYECLVDDLIEKHGWQVPGIPNPTEDDIHFLMKLQRAHDTGTFPGTMRENFVELAKEFNLKWVE